MSRPARAGGRGDPPGLRMLLDGVFDHAGMFPPAELPFAEALAQAKRLGDLRRPWLVGTHMVVPLPELARLDEDALGGWPCRVCVVGVPAAEADQAARTIAAYDGPAEVVSLECTFTDLVDLPALDRARDGPRLYIEAAWPESAWATRGAGFWSAVDDLAHTGPLGVKFRCAGPHALSHAGQDAFIGAAADRGLPIKATQGLHHPFPTDKHPNGFLTLAAAVRLRQMDRFDIAPLLAERDPSALGLDGVSWQAHTLGPDRLAALVDMHPFSIGSCSLSEPDDDLQALYGPLPQAA